MVKIKLFSNVFIAILTMTFSCGESHEPDAPMFDQDASDTTENPLTADAEPTRRVESMDTVLDSDSPTKDSEKSPDSSNPATPPIPNNPQPPIQPPPLEFYPASCAEIKKARPTAVSGQFKIFLNPTLPTRVALDASCDMTEDGGGWTLILNYVHLGGTNPPLKIRANDLPLLAGNTLGTDESSLAISWGHTSNALLKNFAPAELRFYCRSTLSRNIIHFKSKEPRCLKAVQAGTGSCINLGKAFEPLTNHTGILPAGADLGKRNAGDLALTNKMMAKEDLVFDLSWSIGGGVSADTWDCDFGTNDSTASTIHRVWFR